MRFAGHAPPLVLGFERFEDYPVLSPWFGAVVGRFANRIEGGRYVLDGRAFDIERNWLGRHTLHGGAAGMAHRLWRIVETTGRSVRLAYRDEGGAAGFGGNLEVECTYMLTDDDVLVVELTAQSDAPTPCSLAHHSYFNLADGGAGTIVGHRLSIAADHYLPVDADLIPTGEIRAVDGTPFDFRAARSIRLPQPAAPVAYDHNWCLADERRAIERVATLESAASGISLDLWTSEPGLQFYDGGGIPAGLRGLEGIVYGSHSGLCLEPQAWPDAPNRPEFPDPVLRPGQTYRQRSEFRFRRRPVAAAKTSGDPDRI